MKTHGEVEARLDALLGELPSLLGNENLSKAELSRYAQAIRAVCELYDEPPPRVVAVNEWRVLTKGGINVGAYARREWAEQERDFRDNSQAWANHAPHRIARVFVEASDAIA